MKYIILIALLYIVVIGMQSIKDTTQTVESNQSNRTALINAAWSE